MLLLSIGVDSQIAIRIGIFQPAITLFLSPIYIYALSHSSLRAVAAAAAGLVSFRISRIEL